VSTPMMDTHTTAPLPGRRRPQQGRVRPTAPRALVATSVDDLLNQIGPGAGAPVALHASAGRDTRPLTFLTPTALSLRAGQGLAALGLPLPASPVLHVRIDVDAQPASSMRLNDGQSRISVIERPRPVIVAGIEGRLARVLVESRDPDWQVQAPYVLLIEGANEEVGPRLARHGLRPELLVGVTDGCGAFGGNDPFHCVNRPHADCMGHTFAAGTRPTWLVTDHLQLHESPYFTNDFVAGHTYRSTLPGARVSLRAVSRLSSAWGIYGSDGTWLFHCAYDIGGNT